MKTGAGHLTHDDVAALTNVRQRLENAAAHLSDAAKELDEAAFINAASRLSVLRALIDTESNCIAQAIRQGREPKGGL